MQANFFLILLVFFPIFQTLELDRRSTQNKNIEEQFSVEKQHTTDLKLKVSELEKEKKLV